MKEIGEKFKSAREEMGISIKEASEDLKITKEEIENMEKGEMSFFSDVNSLKYLVRDYAKYLGLDKDEVVDDFNEYLFDYTSRISLDDIKNAKKVEKEDKIRSPYTIEHKRKFFASNTFIYIIIFVLLAFIGYFIYSVVVDDDKVDDTIIVNKWGE